MKHLLFSRIQEKLVASSGPGRPAPGSNTAAGRREILEQADWILERIRRTAPHFLRLADQSGLTPTRPALATGHETRRIHALLLAYKLTLTAWRRRQEKPDHDVLDMVRTAMLRELVQLERRTSDDGGPPGTAQALARRNADRDLQSIRRRYLDAADSDVAAAVLRFEAGLPGPLTPFYGNLAPAFGGPCPTCELPARYGKLVGHLFETVEAKLEERVERTTGSKGTTRYAGAGS